MSEKPILNLCVTVVVPFQNDREVLRDTLNALDALLTARYEHHEILLVDNGSSDGSLADAESALDDLEQLRLICLSGRHPLENAIQAGLDAAIGDVIAVLIPGFDPVVRLPELVDQVLAKKTVVVGRLAPRGLPADERIARRFFYWVTNRFLKLGFPEFSSPFMAMTRQSLNSLASLNSKQVYLTAFNRARGTPIDYFEYEPLDLRRRGFRKSGERINLAIDMIVSNSGRPLRLASLTALLLSTVNLGYIGYLVARTFLHPEVSQPWIDVKIQNAANFFVLSLLLSVGGEYLWKALQGIQERQHYFVVRDLRSSGRTRLLAIRNVVADSRG